jgi:hypothetical protein
MQKSPGIFKAGEFPGSARVSRGVVAVSATISKHYFAFASMEDGLDNSMRDVCAPHFNRLVPRLKIGRQAIKGSVHA